CRDQVRETAILDMHVAATPAKPGQPPEEVRVGRVLAQKVRDDVEALRERRGAVVAAIEHLINLVQMQVGGGDLGSQDPGPGPQAAGRGIPGRISRRLPEGPCVGVAAQALQTAYSGSPG